VSDSKSAGAGFPATGVGSFGLMLFLVALAVLFAATVVATWYFRDQAATWADTVPALPPGVWATTALLALLSVFAERGARAAARSGGRAARGALIAAAVCAVLFLVGQAWNWSVLLGGRPRGARVSFYEFNFYLLTLLHALHVVGGLVWMGIAVQRAAAAAPSAAATARSNATYWHFLAGVWAVLLLDLFLSRVEDPAATPLGPASLGLFGLAVAACVGYQLVAIRDFVAHGKRGLAFWAILPPFAFLAYWAHAGDWGRERTLARWTLAGMIALALMLVAIAVHADALFADEGPVGPPLPDFGG
jgi:cytochrome c oxidase subunit 3